MGVSIIQILRFSRQKKKKKKTEIKWKLCECFWEMCEIYRVRNKNMMTQETIIIMIRIKVVMVLHWYSHSHARFTMRLNVLSQNIFWLCWLLLLFFVCFDCLFVCQQLRWMDKWKEMRVEKQQSATQHPNTQLEIKCQFNYISCCMHKVYTPSPHTVVFFSFFFICFFSFHFKWYSTRHSTTCNAQNEKEKNEKTNNKNSSTSSG